MRGFFFSAEDMMICFFRPLFSFKFDVGMVLTFMLSFLVYRTSCTKTSPEQVAMQEM